MTKIPQFNYPREAAKGRTPISNTYGRRKTSIIGKHAASRRERIGDVVYDYESGNKEPRKYASPQKIAQYGRDARISLADAIDFDARGLMLPHAYRAGQPKYRVAANDAERSRTKGITRVRTPAQLAAARRNLVVARARRRG